MATVAIPTPACKILISELYGEQPTPAAVHPRAVWLQAVADVTTKAAAALPDESTERVRKAEQIVLKGDVELLPDGTAQVTSQRNGITQYHVNGRCECVDFAHAPQHLCKHRIAVAIQKRALALAKTHLAALDAPPVVDAPAASPADSTPPASTVPAQYVVMIQGNPFVRYTGLLQMAHERGLVALTEQWTYNDASLSLAEAVATFSDGGQYRGAGDASPENVTKTVAPHFRRISLTRAKARCLRDALAIDMCSVEELGCEE